MNIKNIKKEHKACCERLSYLGIISLFQHCLDSVTNGERYNDQEIESLKLVYEKVSHTRFAEDNFFVRIEGGEHSFMQKMPLHSWVEKDFFIDPKHLAFKEDFIVFKRDSDLSPLLESSTVQGVHSTYLKERLNFELSKSKSVAVKHKI